ncbi:MAG: hypothetical protein ACR2IA_03375 [Pyrinomonadaceae bacterium]
MILDIVESIDGVPIRLTDERWEHITDEHPYMNGFYDEVLKSIDHPEFITRGQKGTKIAVVNLGRSRWLHVMYREINRNDGFIITAFIDEFFEKNKIIWSRHS